MHIYCSRTKSQSTHFINLFRPWQHDIYFLGQSLSLIDVDIYSNYKNILKTAEIIKDKTTLNLFKFSSTLT